MHVLFIVKTFVERGKSGLVLCVGNVDMNATLFLRKCEASKE